MNENMPNNNENVEEVPLDLFNQVSLDDYQPAEEPLEMVELNNSTPAATPAVPIEDSGDIISIPAGAYEAAIAAMNNSNGPQNN